MNPTNESVDLRREHHWFSYKRGREEGRIQGFNGKPDFPEGIIGFPTKVDSNPGYGSIDVVPAAYQQGFEEGYPEGVAEREELEAKIAQQRPNAAT